MKACKVAARREIILVILRPPRPHSSLKQLSTARSESLSSDPHQGPSRNCPRRTSISSDTAWTADSVFPKEPKGAASRYGSCDAARHLAGDGGFWSCASSCAQLDPVQSRGPLKRFRLRNVMLAAKHGTDSRLQEDNRQHQTPNSTCVSSSGVSRF